MNYVALKALTHSFLLIGLSPEQISGRMGEEKHSHKVSPTTIYSMVGRLSWKHLLAHKGKTYRRGTKASAGARLIPNRVDIAERPSS
ncbi:MAG: IS30 family transposase, partial [Paraglaciecola sp.]